MLDEILRAPIREALALTGASHDEIVYLLTRMLPELCDRRFAHGQVEAAYDLYHREHPEIDRATQPFSRVELD